MEQGFGRVGRRDDLERCREHQRAGVEQRTWYILTATKATGTVTPRFHVYNYSTGAWTHSAGSTTSANITTTALCLGSADTSGWWPGNILVAAAWNTDFSDGAVEALNLHVGLPQWVASSPQEGWRLDTMSAIQSFGVVGTADEASRVGTTLDTGDAPSGWADVAQASRFFQPIPFL